MSAGVWSRPLLDGPGREAARRGLEGTLRIDRERRLAMVELRGAGAGDGPLWLTLAHPTRAALDLRVRLAPLGGGRHAGALKPYAGTSRAGAARAGGPRVAARRPLPGGRTRRAPSGTQASEPR
ncbi:MAG: hypothetical protein RML12_09640 [Xanthomonadales bacterium]|nr:hypothetical protein [Xanthomonadales bacterium]